MAGRDRENQLTELRGGAAIVFVARPGALLDADSATSVDHAGTLTVEPAIVRTGLRSIEDAE